MERLQHAINWRSKSKSAKAGFIYFIGCHDFIKVGYAENVELRLVALQTGCPYELTLLHKIPTQNMVADESRIHRHWQRYSMRGEWFRLHEGALTLILASETVGELLKN